MAEATSMTRLLDSLDAAQAGRLGHLESLHCNLKECQNDTEELQHLCTEVDKREGEKATFTRMLAELKEMQVAVEISSSKEAELFTPQQYEATLERRLFSNTLGLDIRLTQDRLISLVFDHLDHQNSDRQFRVTLDVSDTGHWQVVNLDPHVHGVDALLGSLNSGRGNITQFCKAFREQCKHYIADKNN